MPAWTHSRKIWNIENWYFSWYGKYLMPFAPFAVLNGHAVGVIWIADKDGNCTENVFTTTPDPPLKVDHHLWKAYRVCPERCISTSRDHRFPAGRWGWGRRSFTPVWRSQLQEIQAHVQDTPERERRKKAKRSLPLDLCVHTSLGHSVILCVHTSLGHSVILCVHTSLGHSVILCVHTSLGHSVILCVHTSLGHSVILCVLL